MVMQARAPLREGVAEPPATIVVGYDGSDEAREAVTLAAERAGPDGTVVVLHVRPSPSRWLDTAHHQSAVDEYERRGREVLDTLSDLASDGPSIVAELVDGKPAEALIREARLYDASEIVVGSRGVGRLRAALGSVSQQLLRDADRPVLVVPARAVRRETEA